ncbi:hypothetical protein U1Q18_052433 [Sarracenia purpurea var. burkii]
MARKRYRYVILVGMNPDMGGSEEANQYVPTGAHSRLAALPKPIIISNPRPYWWKGFASKLYVELPPLMAPLGMEVGLVQACAGCCIRPHKKRVNAKIINKT